MKIAIQESACNSLSGQGRADRRYSVGLAPYKCASGRQERDRTDVRTYTWCEPSRAMVASNPEKKRLLLKMSLRTNMAERA